MKTYRVTNLQALRDLSAEVYGVLIAEASQHDGALVLALHGDLGAGKTTFVQMLIERISSISADSVTSPTFVVMKRYDSITPDNIDAVVHVDAYRIEDPSEMSVLHFEEILLNHRFLVCIEWAEKITPLLPSHTVHLTFAIEEEERIITIQNEVEYSQNKSIH